MDFSNVGAHFKVQVYDSSKMLIRNANRFHKFVNILYKHTSSLSIDYNKIDKQITLVAIMAEHEQRDDLNPQEIAAWRLSGQLAKWSFFVVATSVAISSIVWKVER